MITRNYNPNKLFLEPIMEERDDDVVEVDLDSDEEGEVEMIRRRTVVWDTKKGGAR